MRLARLIVAAACATFNLPSLAAAQDAPPAGLTYESLGALPDLGGSWLPLGGPFANVGTGQAPLPRELRPEAAARAARYREELMSGRAIDRSYCTPQAFGGRLLTNAGGALEILYSPGRVTLATEGGLVRRFYLRDTPPTDALAESRGGTSIARWENGALVVETTGLLPTAPFLPGLPIGHGARVMERILLAEPDTLEIRTTTIAPDILSAPLETVNRYRRDRDRLFTEFDTCADGDRSFDEATGQERFDATPPADLPPPPSG